MGWLIWVGIALVLAATEVATLAFVCILLAGGALIGALAAAVGLPVWAQVVAAVVVSALLLTTVRKSALARWAPQGHASVGVAADIGRIAVVVETVTEFGGRIKLPGRRGVVGPPGPERDPVVPTRGASAGRPHRRGHGDRRTASAGVAVVSGTEVVYLVVLVLVVLFAVIAIARTIRIVPQQTAIIVERLGSYSRTLEAGLHLLIPFVDRARAIVDQREQVVNFPPQPVITSDNLVVSIDTVIYFQVTEPK